MRVLRADLMCVPGKNSLYACLADKQHQQTDTVLSILTPSLLCNLSNSSQSIQIVPFLMINLSACFLYFSPLRFFVNRSASFSSVLTKSTLLKTLHGKLLHKSVSHINMLGPLRNRNVITQKIAPKLSTLTMIGNLTLKPKLTNTW